MESKFLSDIEVLSNLKQELQKNVEHLKGELSVIRAGRANPKILDRVMVDYYGSPTPLNQMSNITVPDPRSLLVSIWDLSAFKDVLKAINEANLGVNVSDDGKSIRLNFPVLTEERRKELVKNIKKIGEDTKIALRNNRRDALDSIKQLKKDNALTEDDVARNEKEVQKILDAQVEEVEKILANKEKEILEV